MSMTSAQIDEIIEHVINANMLNMPYDVYSDLFDAVDGLGVEMEKLEAENEKLRELVSEMYEDECDECDRWKYRDRIRELGVDV